MLREEGPMSHQLSVRALGIWATGVAGVLAASAAWVFAVYLHDAQDRVAAEESMAAASASAKDPGSEPGAKPPRGEASGTKSALPTPHRTKAEEAEFPDPSVIADRFTTQLTRLIKQHKVVAPSELFRQAQQAKQRCDVASLPEPSERLAPEAIYARAKPAVVVIGAVMRPPGHRAFHAALASGFVIRGDGVMVTNYHVIEAFQHAKAVAAMTHDERVLPIQKVLAADEHNDLAVVKAEAENLTALPIAASAPVGATVYCLSHPALDSDETETAFFTFTQGIVCGKFYLRLNGPNPLNVLAITAEYAKGSSGGPILNERGAVVGIICQTRALFHDSDETEPQLTWKFARPSSSLLALLQAAAPTK